MKLEQLTYVVEVANAKSISKAADNLLLSQPGLSAAIKQLEAELGTELFIRNRRGVELTETGRHFLVYAKRIVKQVNALEKFCKNDAEPMFQSLSIASFYFRFSGAVSAMMVNKYKKEGTKFVIRHGIVSDCIDWVSEGICDVGLVYFPTGTEAEFKKQLQRKQLNYKTIYQEPLNIIIGAGHPLYNTDITQISLKELQKYTVVSRDPTSPKDYIRSVFLHTEIPPTNRGDLRVIITDQAALYEMLEFTDCYCLGFSNDIVYQNVPGPHKLRTLKISDEDKPAMISIAWIAPANVEFMPLAKEYIELMTDVCTRRDFWELHPDLRLDMQQTL